MILTGLATSLIISCGSDKTNEAKNTTATTTNTNSPIFNTNTNSGQNLGQYWNQLKSQNQCLTGSRMPDMNFVLHQSQYGGNTIQGPLQQSGQAGGSISATYIGRNWGTNDLVYISQMSSGQFNIILSMCTWNGGYGGGVNYPQQFGNQYNGGGTEYIGPNAGMNNFRIDYMTLSNSTSCPTGQVLDGWVSFYSQTYGGEIPTRFTQVDMSCN